MAKPKERMPSIEQLEALATFVEQGSLTAAADELGLKRSTISTRLNRLKGDFGVEIFASVKQDQVRPSELADRLAEPAAGITTLMKEFNRIKAGGAEGHPVLTIRVATYPAPVARFVAGASETFHSQQRRKWERCRVHYYGLDDRLRESQGSVLIDLLLDGAVDMVIAADDVDPGVARVQSLPLYDAGLCIYDPRGLVHKSGQRKVKPADLDRVSLLASPRSFRSRRLLATALRAERVVPKVVVESPSTEALLALADAGVGVAVLPDDALPDAIWSDGKSVSKAIAALVAKERVPTIRYSLYELEFATPDPTRTLAMRAYGNVLRKAAAPYHRRLARLAGASAEPRPKKS